MYAVDKIEDNLQLTRVGFWGPQDKSFGTGNYEKVESQRLILYRPKK